MAPPANLPGRGLPRRGCADTNSGEHFPLMGPAQALYSSCACNALGRSSADKVVGLGLGLCLLLCACATPYKPLEHRYGYSDHQVANGVYEVSFLGNGNTSYEKALDFALLRAAEIALNHHAKSFILLDLANLSFARTYLAAPLFYQTSAAGLVGYGQNPPAVAGLLDWTERGYLVEQPAHEQTYYRPGVRLKMKLLADPPGKHYPYDPARIVAQLKRKYRIKPGKG